MPRERGQCRFKTGPCPTATWLTKSFSAESFELFSALAMADFNVFVRWKAPFRSLNSTTRKASETGKPLIARAKSLTFDGEILTYRVVALISISMSLNAPKLSEVSPDLPGSVGAASPYPQSQRPSPCRAHPPPSGAPHTFLLSIRQNPSPDAPPEEPPRR